MTTMFILIFLNFLLLGYEKGIKFSSIIKCSVLSRPFFFVYHLLPRKLTWVCIEHISLNQCVSIELVCIYYTLINIGVYINTRLELYKYFIYHYIMYCKMDIIQNKVSGK